MWSKMEYPSAWLVAVFVFVGTFYYIRHRRKNFPPGPVGLPLIGYIPFLGKNPPETYRNLANKYGSILSVNIGSESWVILNDYDSIHEALVKHGDAFSGRPQLHVMQRLTGGYGIIFRDNDAGYREQRKFALNTLRGFGVGKRSMEDRITEEIEYLSEMIESKNGESFNCQKILASSTANVICSITMGSRFSYDNATFQGMVERLTQGFSSKTEAFLQTMVTLAGSLRYIPPFSGAYERFFKEAQFILNAIQVVLEEHKSTLDINNIRDFIDEYLKEMKLSNGTNSSFKEAQLFQIIRDFFLAGTETTSSTLRWCVLCFAEYPQIQEKVFTEVKDIIGHGVPSMKHKNDMPYTSSFIHEITRYRTVIPLAVPHVISHDVNIRGFDIPKGTPVFPNLYAAHRDCKYFKKPDEFRPERFLSEDGQFVPDNHVIPFSIGPRFCLGEQLAKMELFLFVTNISQRFEIVADPEKPLPSFNKSISGLVEVPMEFDVYFNSRR